MDFGDSRDRELVLDDVRVEAGWIDYNGHLNMAYYLVLFDRAADGLVDALGLSRDPGSGPTLFAVEANVRYLREVHRDHVLRCVTRVVGYDDKRVRTEQTLHHDDGTPAATCANVHIHVARGPNGPKVVPFADNVRVRLDALVLSDDRS